MIVLEPAAKSRKAKPRLSISGFNLLNVLKNFPPSCREMPEEERVMGAGAFHKKSART
jgi:hypothetical protein